MKYFSIQETLNSKILGNNPQVKDIIYNCDVWDEPLFIDRFHFEKIDVKPIVANPILFNKSKLTDLIDTKSSMGFSYTKLISGKLKNAIQKNNNLQFFQCSIFKDKIEYSDYWLLNIFEFYDDEYIDFENSIIYYEKQSEDYNSEKILLDVKTLPEFLKYYEITQTTMESIYIEKLKLKKEIKQDFFALKFVFGSIYYVSEKLKKEIEDANCTGIEFQPAELSSNEWLQGGEREKVYGKC